MAPGHLEVRQSWARSQLGADQKQRREKTSREAAFVNLAFLVYMLALSQCYVKVFPINVQADYYRLPSGICPYGVTALAVAITDLFCYKVLCRPLWLSAMLHVIYMSRAHIHTELGFHVTLCTVSPLQKVPLLYFVLISSWGFCPNFPVFADFKAKRGHSDCHYNTDHKASYINSLSNSSFSFSKASSCDLIIAKYGKSLPPPFLV